MSESIAKIYFPSLFNKLQKKKQAVRNVPLTMNEINTLMNMYFNNKPLFPSIETFYTDEYMEALKRGAPCSELERIQRFRRPTEKELNLLYNDIHEREEKEQYTGSNQPD